MNPCRFLSAFALVLLVAPLATAQVNVQLNLRYNEPCFESGGGTWELLVGSEAGGVAGLSVLIDNINNDATAAGGTGFEVFETQQVGSVIEIVTGSNLEAPLDTDVGLGVGTTGNVADDLFPGNSPAIWANNALVASGTFGSVRPSFVATAGTLTEGVNVFSGSAAVAGTFGVQSVRGDGMATDGLMFGDADRDGDVDGDDFNLLAFSFGDAGAGWDMGNFDCMNGTDGDDFNLLAFNFGTNGSPPAISAVPEPSTLSVAGVCLLTCGLVRRRR